MYSKMRKRGCEKLGLGAFQGEKTWPQAWCVSMICCSQQQTQEISDCLSRHSGSPPKVVLILLRAGLGETQVQVRHCILGQIRDHSLEGDNTSDRCGCHSRSQMIDMAGGVYPRKGKDGHLLVSREWHRRNEKTHSPLLHCSMRTEGITEAQKFQGMGNDPWVMEFPVLSL